MKLSSHKIKSVKKYLYPIITIIILLVAWEILSITKNEPKVFPGIGKICIAFFHLFTKNNLSIISLTILRIVISVLITFIVTFIISLLYLWKKETYYFFKPIIDSMRSIPLAVISVFLFILLTGNLAPYFITILVILPVVVEGVITGIDNIDQNLLDDLKLINTSFFKSIFYVYIPLIKNYLLMTFVQAFGLGLKVMIMGEFICYTKNSVGKELSIIKSAFEMSELLAWGILIVITVVVIEYISKLIINKKIKIVKNK